MNKFNERLTVLYLVSYTQTLYAPARVTSYNNRGVICVGNASAFPDLRYCRILVSFIAWPEWWTRRTWDCASACFSNHHLVSPADKRYSGKGVEATVKGTAQRVLQRRKPGSDEEITFYVVFTGDRLKLRVSIGDPRHQNTRRNIKSQKKKLYFELISRRR